MRKSETILVYEYGRLVVGESYKGVEFQKHHLLALGKYQAANPEARYFTTYLGFVTFNQFVGVIRVGELTIEVLPKTDNNSLEIESWQRILFKMLMISLQVEAKITSPAAVALGKQSVLDAYIRHFLDQVMKLIHDGLVKKYRTIEANQRALNGKLLLHQNITKNITHAERFYVQHQVYDRDNIFNSILFQSLACLENLDLSDELRVRLMSCRLDFPDCSNVLVNEELFSRLVFDRKTERYRSAIALARIILLNYHPDVRSGSNNVLAIMFDMNALWETYIYAALRRSSIGGQFEVIRHATQLFWKADGRKPVSLEPDLVIRRGERTIVLDTKWKYRKATSSEDVRQMYAYGVYFRAEAAFLVYPDNLVNPRILIADGQFFNPSYSKADPTSHLHSKERCGLIFIDPIENSDLDRAIGSRILDLLFNSQIH